MDSHALIGSVQAFDQCILDHLIQYLKTTISSLQCHENKEINLPTSLSPGQLTHIFKMLKEEFSQVDVKLQWFYPIVQVKIRKRQQDDLQVPLSINFQINLLQSVREQLSRFLTYKMRRGVTIREQFTNHFSMATYSNTPPVVPRIIARNYGSDVEDHSSEVDLLLQRIYCTEQIQVISGMGRDDKLELLAQLNNQCAMQQQPCRIIYLQSLSILTFWMGLKFKEMCCDEWNSIGFQITLESKTSPSNSIIFLEMATFIRLLSRDLRMNLITHLVIDIDQNHLLFCLFFFYLKENIESLHHLKIFILTQNESQAKQIIDYFNPHTYYTNFSKYLPTKVNTSVTQVYLDDFISMPAQGRNVGVSEMDNFDQLLINCWKKEVDMDTLISFLLQCDWLVNYQSPKLNGISSLVVAIRHGSLAQVQNLLNLGADCHLASWNDLQPIEWAIQFKREQVFQLLFTHIYATNASFDLNLQHYYTQKFLLAPTIGSKQFTGQTTSNVTSSKPPLFDIDYEIVLRLLKDLIQYIVVRSSVNLSGASLGSILILLPSYNCVSTLRRLIIASFANFDCPFIIFSLYPHMPNNELEESIRFLSQATNQVRVLLSTFTVDSVLLNDIFYVINAGVRLDKVQSTFSSTNLYRLISNKRFSQLPHGIFNQKNSLVFYNLYYKSDSTNLISDPTFDLTSDSLYHCIFAAKCFKFKNDKILDIFNQMIYHPKTEIVSNSLLYLKNINVFDENEQLTEFGKILVDLSIEPHYAKMIIYSVILRCLDPILTIVCSLSSPNSIHLNSNDPVQREQDLTRLYELSHNGFSDHLTYVYAFQRWQDLYRSTNKVPGKLDQRDIVIFSSFEMIYSLRTKILGQLRAIGFVKGKGPMNIRQLNANSDNFSLVKAAICAGQPLDHFAQIDASSGCCKTSSANEVTYFDPNSVFSYYDQKRSTDVRFPTNMILFDRKITCGNVSYIQNCTLINPLTMAIFTEEPTLGRVSYKNRNLDFNGLFVVSGECIDKIYQTRQRWQTFLKRRLLSMQHPLSEEENQMFRDLVRLVTTSDQSLGFTSHSCIGRAPQVMSTYFCLTHQMSRSPA